MEYNSNKQLNSKGYDYKSGWMEKIDSDKEQLFSTEGEYDEYIRDYNKDED